MDLCWLPSGFRAFFFLPVAFYVCRFKFLVIELGGFFPFGVGAF